METKLLDIRIPHKAIEAKWQAKWANEKTYKSVSDSRPRFSMCIPPPKDKPLLAKYICMG